MNIIEKDYDFAYTSNTRKVTSHIILHHAAAGVADPDMVHGWHLARGWAGIGYHFYIRKDGTVYRGRPEHWYGGHTTNMNYCSIGICFEGNFEVEYMPDAQKRAGAELVAYLKDKYPGIKVGKHREYNATACPGKNFPFDFIAAGATLEPEDDDAERCGLPSTWAVSACNKAREKGVFRGDGKGNFNWQEPMTREAFCVVLDRLGLLE